MVRADDRKRRTGDGRLPVREADRAGSGRADRLLQAEPKLKLQERKSRKEGSTEGRDRRRRVRIERSSTVSWRRGCAAMEERRENLISSSFLS
jgi:hypothetical protein